ncbi:protein kinase domain-containing protein [Colletotrichum musicola]|uniref:Protein kinase domain-containing protein n=1 Tax=Colletotrichum musicola TaxID=2175873 RepID=A0A8H6MSN2_9PEZI|nr:protein kinase domain-containing protein [Colletotrichum musicola]
MDHYPSSSTYEHGVARYALKSPSVASWINMTSSEFHSNSCPHHNKSSSSSSTGSPILTLRYDLDINCNCRVTLPSRQNECMLSVTLYGPDGARQPAHQGGPQELRGTASDISDTRSVLSVYELGLNSAPAAFDIGHGTTEPRHAEETEGSLRERIEDRLEWSQFDHQEYLPLDAFEDIFNADSIKSLVSQGLPTANGPQNVQKHVAEIWEPNLRKGRRRILAILIFMGALHCLDDFIRGDLFDDDLPLCQERTCRAGFRTRAATVRSDRINSTLMKDWTRKERDLFYVDQPRFCVPFFGSRPKELLSHVFSNDIRLPWNHYKRITNGGNGVVYQLRIHPSHHDFKAYQFWEKTPTRDTLTPSLTSWVGKQCLGIATAVKRIQGLATWQKDRRSSGSSTSSSTEKEYGRHGDIKPQNILWFSRHGKDVDLLVVSDLGLTRFHLRLTKSLVSHLDGYTGAYRAPEIELGRHISQRYDVWSLGCVFLEFCVSYLLGMRGVREFEDHRLQNYESDIIGFEEDCFFVMTNDPSRAAELNPAVNGWMERLRALSIRTDFSDQLLDLIETKCCIVNSLSIVTHEVHPKTEQCVLPPSATNSSNMWKEAPTKPDSGREMWLAGREASQSPANPFTATTPREFF